MARVRYIVILCFFLICLNVATVGQVLLYTMNLLLDQNLDELENELCRM